MSHRLTRGRKRQIEERLEEFNIGIPIDEFGCELPYDEPKAKNSKNNKKKDDRGWDGNVVLEIKKTPTDNKKDKRKRCHESSPESSPTYYRKIKTKVTVHHHIRPSSPELETERSKVFPLKDIDEMIDDIVVEPTEDSMIPIDMGIEAVEVEQEQPETSITENCFTVEKDSLKATEDDGNLEVQEPDNGNSAIDHDITAVIDDLQETDVNPEIPIPPDTDQVSHTTEETFEIEPEKITDTPISSKTTSLNFDEIQLLSSEIIAECEAA